MDLRLGLERGVMKVLALRFLDGVELGVGKAAVAAAAAAFGALEGVLGTLGAAVLVAEPVDFARAESFLSEARSRERRFEAAPGLRLILGATIFQSTYHSYQSDLSCTIFGGRLWANGP